MTLIHGDDEFGSSDLVGNDHGYRKSKLIDNFIHSVVKTEETMKTLWTDNRLTTACRYGHVLIYDEFTRSRPEANNVLLSVLGERLLNLPKKCNGGDGYLEVHPAFRAIFTSNPQEYAGVHKSQDALLDRLITIYMDHYGRDTEVAITASSGGVSAEMAEQIVDLVHFFRKRDPSGQHPSIRAAIMIARVLGCQGLACDPANPLVLSTCRDVLHIGNPCGRAKNPAPSLDLQSTLQAIWGSRRNEASDPSGRRPTTTTMGAWPDWRPTWRPPPRPKRCSYEEQTSQRPAGHPHPQQPDRRRGQSAAEVPPRGQPGAEEVALQQGSRRRPKAVRGNGQENRRTRRRKGPTPGIGPGPAARPGGAHCGSAFGKRYGIAGTMCRWSAARLRTEVLRLRMTRERRKRELMTTQELPVRRPTLVQAQAAVRAFLQEALPDVHRVDVTRVMRIEFNEGGWEADAAVWQPNATIQALGLSTEHPVLDQNFYVVRLDGELNVIGYESKEAESQS